MPPIVMLLRHFRVLGLDSLGHLCSLGCFEFWPIGGLGYVGFNGLGSRVEFLETQTQLVIHIFWVKE